MKLSCKLIFPILIAAGSCFYLPGRTFKEEQLHYPRVRKAYRQKEGALKELFQQKRLTYPPAGIYIRVFKWERSLELWVQGNGGEYVLLKDYPVCVLSGTLGPKKRERDVQVPEGFYFIDLFNPENEFYLALRINYPNALDRMFNPSEGLGGNIYIHGSCESKGCIPIQDENIEEVYVLAVEASAAGQSPIPVHIFPARLSDEKMRWLKDSFSWFPRQVAFWEGMKHGYDLFERQNRLPQIAVTRDGRYRVR